MSSFNALLRDRFPEGLSAESLDILQVNLGLRCNLACAHCHLEAHPDRAEEMDWPTMELLLEKTADRPSVLFDLTGGSPEMNPHLPRLLEALAARGTPVRVRTNLSVLDLPEYRHLSAHYKNHRVRLVASVPCYLEENVAAQRGQQAFPAIVNAIRELNRLGYGHSEDLPLDLVYNPGGPFLPPDQHQLEQAYKRELLARYGITFTRLLTIANMPIGRFREALVQTGNIVPYQTLLRSAFNPSTLPAVMCRRQLSVAWDGYLYDCDFNLALGLSTADAAPGHLTEFAWEKLETRSIVTGEHCFGCTAGCGSSCGGTLISA